MSEERVKNLMDAIDAYGNNEALFAMSKEEACEVLNAGGNDFTTDELVEFAQAVQTVSKMKESGGELSEDELSDVSGGCLVVSFLLGCATGAYLGYKVFWS